MPQTTKIKQPVGYILRMAFNIAEDRRRRDARIVSTAEIESFLDEPDEASDPMCIFEARAEIEALERALAELSYRRRSIVVGSRVEELKRREIAERFGSIRVQASAKPT